MKEKWEKPLGEFPESFLDKVAKVLRNYHVSFIRKDSFHGSGTLIRCMGRSGILTACHVLYGSDGTPLFQFSDPECPIYFVIDEVERQFYIPAACLTPHIIGRPNPGSEEEGPDLAFLEIHDCAKLESLKALKSFFSFDFKSKERLEFCEDQSRQFWALAHSLGEGTKIVRHPGGLIQGAVRSDISFTGPTAPAYQEGNFDYIGMSVDYGSGCGIASTFGGASGGGLWKVEVVYKKSADEFEAKDFVLAGVAFYQSAVQHNRRTIKCHGPRSLYRNLLYKL